MAQQPLVLALTRVSVFAAASAAAGWWIGYFWPVMAAAGWLLAIYHVSELARLVKALGRAREGEFRYGQGLWADVASHLRRARRQQDQRERALRNALGKYRDAIEAVPDVAVALNDAGELLWLNRAAAELLGLRIPQDVGRPVANLVRHPAFLGFLDGSTGGDSVDFRAPADPSRLLRARLIPYGQGQRLLIASDITQMHRLEQVRRDFVANVSHELRSPLTVVNGYLETLLDAEDPSLARWHKALATMQGQSSRMLNIIEDLLMLSRLEDPDEKHSTRPVDVGALLESIAEDARALSGEKHHDIQIVAEPGLWLSGNEKELRSAFSNLVFNAVRYTGPGCRVCVRWQAATDGPRLSVEDDGEGIPPQHLPRLTERFYRVDKGRQRESGGTGLGLAIVKHVMHRHQGRLLVASELGVGSTFTCQFPQHRALSGRGTKEG